ncbi:uncharacterized protein LOC125521533 isoform X2 [Triticum urartu]|nr:uncharacterized protein LOC125521533 isoform X2 [Triticum urartu]
MAAQGLLLPRSVKPAAGNDLHSPGPRRPHCHGLRRARRCKSPIAQLLLCNEQQLQPLQPPRAIDCFAPNRPPLRRFPLLRLTFRPGCKPPPPGSSPSSKSRACWPCRESPAPPPSIRARETSDDSSASSCAARALALTVLLPRQGPVPDPPACLGHSSELGLSPGCRCR